MRRYVLTDQATDTNANTKNKTKRTGYTISTGRESRRDPRAPAG